MISEISVHCPCLLILNPWQDRKKLMEKTNPCSCNHFPLHMTDLTQFYCQKRKNTLNIKCINCVLYRISVKLVRRVSKELNPLIMNYFANRYFEFVCNFHQLFIDSKYFPEWIKYTIDLSIWFTTQKQQWIAWNT